MTQASPLRRRMIEDMTVRNLSPATQRSYSYCVIRFGLCGLCCLIGRRQHGHRGSVLSNAAAISSRKVVMDDGTWRCVRWAAARLVMRG